MKLSVILAVKEIDRYIITSVDSIINQNIKNLEVIIVDEEDTDKSAELLKQYKDINNIFIYNYYDKSFGSSLNFGLSKASGDFVLFMQAMDYLEDGFLSDVMDRLSIKMDMFKFNFSLFNGSGVIPERTYTYEVKDGMELLKKVVKNNERFDRLNKYIFNRKFLLDSNVTLNKGDFYSELGVITYLLAISKKVENSELVGYIYRLENNEYRKGYLKDNKDMAYDVLNKYGYLEFLNFSAKYSEEDKKYILSYISNVVVKQLDKLEGRDKKEFRKVIKSKNIFDNVKKEGIFSRLFRSNKE